jgi:hypothetical protein
VVIAKLENNIFEYEGENNIVLLPITRFVRKDGNLAVTSPITKLFMEKYPNLSKKWGYMIKSEIPFPAYKTSTTNLLGLANRNHYASAISLEEFEAGLWYVKEESLLKPDFIFYLQEENFMDVEKIKEIFKETDNFVLLRKGEEHAATT